ncbi:MAG: methionyl-tRNA formyltransferase [Bacteroidota bacterium]
MSKKLRIVFFGTPDFAAASLQKLIENKVNVVAIVTAPDRPRGRGKKLGTSAVKDYAIKVCLPILQPSNLKSPDFIEELKSLQADLQIVVAFRMLPVIVWDLPALGTINLHASLLPQYRGAAPINWVIINGEKETGVTTFFLKHEIDTGEIIFQNSEPIYNNDNAGTLYRRLMHKGADLVLKTVHAIQLGEYPRIPQKSTEKLVTAPKIFKEDCKIDWNRPAEKVRNFIRGLSPYPGAWTSFNGKILKIFDVELSGLEGKEPGKYSVRSAGEELMISCQDHQLEITELQQEGKKRMSSDEFLRGHTFQ